MSPDGNYVAIMMQNGSNKPSSHPNYHKDSVLSIFRINGTKLTLAAKAEFGAWGQGVVWSKDGKTLLAQSMADKSIDVFSFDGKALEKDRQYQGQRRRGRHSHRVGLICDGCGVTIAGAGRQALDHCA